MLSRLNFLFKPFGKLAFQSFNFKFVNYNFKTFSLCQERIPSSDSVLLSHLSHLSLSSPPTLPESIPQDFEKIKAELMNKTNKIAKRKRAKRKYGKKISLRYK